MRFPALVLVPLLALGLTAARAASLPDTGQDLCDNGSNVLVACSSANTGDAATYPRQDGRFGRDAKAAAGTLIKIGGGAAGFDYTKIANNGSDLPVSATLSNDPTYPTGWACTRDNITALTWEVKTADGGLRDMNWTYTWYNSDGSTNAGNAGTPDTGAGVGSDNCLNTSRCDTEKFVADVNAAPGLCGFTDWRMPTRRELLTLVHAGAPNPGIANPSIDATYFPNTIGYLFWSGSSQVRDPTAAWYVFFGSGDTWVAWKSSGNYVRLVRGVPF
jgi:hypothetical protein